MWLYDMHACFVICKVCQINIVIVIHSVVGEHFEFNIKHYLDIDLNVNVTRGPSLIYKLKHRQKLVSIKYLTHTKYSTKTNQNRKCSLTTHISPVSWRNRNAIYISWIMSWQILFTLKPTSSTDFRHY